MSSALFVEPMPPFHGAVRTDGVLVVDGELAACRLKCAPTVGFARGQGVGVRITFDPAFDATPWPDPWKPVAARGARCVAKGSPSERGHTVTGTDGLEELASALVMAGVDLRTVQELLGHKTQAMTLRYSHLSPGRQLDAVQRLTTRPNCHRYNTDAATEETNTKPPDDAGDDGFLLWRKKEKRDRPGQVAVERFPDLVISSCSSFRRSGPQPARASAATA